MLRLYDPSHPSYEGPDLSEHRPRSFDPVRHGEVTVIFPNDNFLWNSGHRDRAWDHDVEAIE